MPLTEFVAVPIPHALFMRLATRWPSGISGGIEDVLQDFLDRTEEDFRAERTSEQGWQWDAVHLPHGSELRTKYYGDYVVASIQDGKLIWNEEEFRSVSQLASAMRGGTSNNAWKVMEVRRAGEQSWIPADRLRR